MRRLTAILKLKAFWVGTAVFAGGVVFAGAGSEFMHQTNTNEFCVSCHSMSTVNEEYMASIHFRNAAGVQATCADCHVPEPLGPLLAAKVIASKDVYHEIAGTIDTREKFEARRWKLANVVWDKMEATNSRECRTCHGFEHMDHKAQGRKVARRHTRAVESGKTCINCHKGVAHVEPLPPEDVALR
ncbi:MAG: butanol dehydrogenase [Gammaproteobacteria bacterium]|nr:butanol dehydrogenase [Gammaproteobacteria bacterium]|tara:strand:+ start:170 stop:727 length:558 start_codon:yes stop_codon:yes gene_type:complete